MYQSALLSGVVSLDDGKFKATLKQMEGASESTFKKIADAAAAYLTVKMLGSLVKSSVAAFVTQENAVEGVRASLRNLGAEVDGTAARYEQFAKMLQSKTTFGDETILATMSQGLKMGIRPEDIEKVTTAAIGLSAKLGVDLPTAMQLVVRASHGHAQMLSRYGLAIDTTKSKEEQFQDVLKAGNESFSLAEDAAKTAGGRLTQVGNDLGDAWEKVGEEFVPIVLACAAALKGLADVFNDADKSTRTAIVSATALGVVLGILVKTGVLAKANAIALAIAHGVSATAATANATAHGVLAGAIHAAAVAANTLNAALGPVGWAIIALSAAYVAINYIIDKHTEALDNQVKAAKNAADEAAKEVRETKALHDAQNQGVERLRELEKYERLNSEEKQEAKTIIGELQKAYGDLGVSIDENTGKLNINAQALARVGEEQRRVMAQKLENKVSYQKDYVDALYTRHSTGSSRLAKEVKEIGKQPTWQRLKIIEDAYNISVAKGNEDAQKVYGELLKAEKELQKRRQARANFNKGVDEATKARIKAIGEEKRKAIDAITDIKWKAEFDTGDAEHKAKMLSQKIEDILSKSGYKSLGDMLQRAERGDLSAKQLENLKKLMELNRERQKLLTQSARAFKEEEKALERFEAERQQQIDSAEQERELKRLKQTGDADTINSFLYAQLHNAADTAVALRAEYEEAIAEAKKDNIMTEAEKSQIAELFDAYQRALSDQDKWQDRIDDREENGEVRKAVGGFSAAVLAAQLGGDSPAKETAENTRAMRRMMEESKNNEDGGVTLGV